MSQVGLYIPSSVSPNRQLLRSLETLGLNQLFVEQGVELNHSQNAQITQCYWHDSGTKIDESVAIISQVSPVGAIFAGSRSLPIVSSAATTPAGFNALKTNWELYEREAAQAGHYAHRNKWSLVTPMHLADTRRRAKSEVENIPNWLIKHPALNKLFSLYANPIDALVESGFAVIGSRRDALSQIQRISLKTGGFGRLLFLLHGWASPEKTYRSLELCLEATEALLD